MKGSWPHSQKVKASELQPSQKQKPRNRARGAGRKPAALLLLAALPVVAAAVVATGATNASATRTIAQAAHTLSVADTGRLHLVHNGGEYITEEGEAKGTIPGKVRAYLEVGPVVVAKFTIYTSVGTISGEGSGRPKGRSEEPSFQGGMTVSHGTGRYKGARGRGSFYGSLNRSSYKLYVKTTGTLSY